MIAALDIGIVMGLILAWSVLGLTLSYRLLDFPDLTIEASLLIGGASYAVLHRAGFGLFVATVLAVVAGGLAGAVTGWINSRFRINKFLCGIIVISIAYTVGLRLMGSSNIGQTQASTLLDLFAPLDQGGSLPFHVGSIVFLTLLAAGIIGFLFLALRTQPGLKMRVAGSNPGYARSLGIPVSRNIVLGLFITNSLSALSGVLLVMHQGFADISMGQGVLVISLAAMTIGERLLPERRMSLPTFVVFAAILGSIVYQTILALAIGAGLAATDLRLATAMFVLVVVALKLTGRVDLLEEEA
ncbi:MAG: ABC transporter permease [Blastocatellia bacterium]|nr:ABC transporter permease [Blastocatellia bacterium]